MHIITLSTCHNRREHTLSCIESLQNQALPDGVTLTHYLVDDGCTDGTFIEVSRRFPSVSIIRGNGSLYWSGGMIFGWRSIIRNVNFDYLFVYNDDVKFYAKAISNLINTGKNIVNNMHVIVGSVQDREGKTSYGGLKRCSWWHPLKFKLIEPSLKDYKLVETLNMNAALISRSMIDAIGFLSSKYNHGFADYDYGIRARKNGGLVVLSAGYIGECDRNFDSDNFIQSSTSLSQCYASLLSLKNQPIRQRLYFYKTHGGTMGMFYALLPYIALPFKYLYLKKIQGIISKRLLRVEIKPNTEPFLPFNNTDQCGNCPCCGNARYNTNWARESGFTLIRCGECSLLYVYPSPATDSIDEAVRAGFHRRLGLSVISKPTPKKIRKYKKSLKKIFPEICSSKDPITYVDVGCGYGELLEAARACLPTNSRVIGYEPMKPKALVARSNGLDVINDYLAPNSVKAEIISVVDVFSHVPDFHKFLATIKTNLTDGGLLFLESGNLADLETRDQFPDELGLPDHLVFAGEATLRRYLEEAGFHIETIDFIRVDTAEYFCKNVVKRFLGRPVRVSLPYMSKYRQIQLRARLQMNLH